MATLSHNHPHGQDKDYFFATQAAVTYDDGSTIEVNRREGDGTYARIRPGFGTGNTGWIRAASSCEFGSVVYRARKHRDAQAAMRSLVID